MIVLGVLIFWIVPSLIVAWLLCQVYMEHRSDRVPILLYHRLLSKADADAGRVPDNEMIWTSYDTSFKEQMNYLKDAGYTTIDLDDYVEIRNGTKPLPSKPIIVTFDDGYLSNYTMGYPVLKRNGQKAVIYAAPEPDDHSYEVIEGIDGFLNDDQMREMSDNGVSIQSHTLTHCILSELDADAMRHELLESQRRIAQATGKAVHHIAIPRAGGSRAVRKAIVESGYLTSCGNDKGTASGWSSLYKLPRIVVERDMTIQDFADCLTPRRALLLRVIGNIKRIPERIGGGRFAYTVREMMYNSPLRSLLTMHGLKRLVVLFALLYIAGAILFTLYWFNRGSVGV